MAITHVQGTGVTALSTTSTSIGPITVASGNVAVLILNRFAASTIGVSDSLGNTWIQKITETYQATIEIWYSIYTFSGSNTITITSSNATDLRIAYDEFNPGSGNSFGYDNSGGAYTSGTAIDTTAITVSGTDVFSAGFAAASGTVTATITGLTYSGYGPAGSGLWTGYSLGVTTTQQAYAAYSTSVNTACAGIAFKSTSASNSGSMAVTVHPDTFAGSATSGVTWTHAQGGIGNSTGSSVLSLTISSANGLSPVTAGNLAIVSFTYGSNATCSVSDSLGNIWTQVDKQATAVKGEVWYSQITTPGTDTITVTSSVGNGLEISYDEYNPGPGDIFALDNHNGAIVQPGSSISTGTVTTAGTDLFFASFGATGGGSMALSGVTNLRYSSSALWTGDSLNVTTSQAATGSYSLSSFLEAIGVTFRAFVPAIGVSPIAIPASHSGNITLTLTGSGTSWSGSPFSVSGVSGVALVSQNVTSTTAATIVVSTSSMTGTLTVSDGTHTGTVLIKAAWFTIAPPGVGASLATTITATGHNTLWTQETASTLFSVAGLSGASISSIVVANNTSATFTFTTGSTTGAATITDSSTTQTTTLTCFALPPSFSAVPFEVPANSGTITVILNGISTSWVNGTTIFTASGVSGVSVSSQSISSTTLASVTLATGTTTGTLTISDGSYSTTIPVVTPANIAPAYVSRNGQTAYFLANSWANTVASPPTFGVVDTLVTNGGSGYTAPTAVIKGGVSLTLTFGGSNYSSAPSVIISGDGSGASATAILSNQAVSGFTVTPGSGYSHATVLLSGGGGLFAAATASIVANGGTGCVLGTPVVSGGVIKQIPVVVPGSGYTTAPPITITDANGSSATATAVMGGPITPITALNSLPTIKVNGSVIQIALYVTKITITNPGSGYTTAPTITLSAGSGIAATAAVIGTVIITVTSGGSGYTTAPNVALVFPNEGTRSGSDVTATISGGTVTAITFGTDQYYSVPIVVITGGGGSGATATARIVPAGGTISSSVIKITNPGSGFKASDTITAVFSAPSSGVTATGTAVLGPLWPVETAAAGNADTSFIAFQMLCGGVASIVVQNGGTGYTGTPTVTISGPGGSGTTTGTPTVKNGVITAITFSNYGTNVSHGDTLYVSDSTLSGSGFIGIAQYSASSGSYTSALIESGGQSYSSTLANLSVNPNNALQGGATASVTQVSNGVLATIPVTSPGTGYTGQATVTISGGGGSGAVAVAIMSGPLSTDTVTYSASSGWLTTSAGNVGGATNAPMYNSAGVIEPWFSKVPKTVQVGFAPGGYDTIGNNYHKLQNHLKVISGFTGAVAPAVTITDSTGVLAVAHAVVNSSGQVASIVVDCGGTGYSGSPTVTIASPPSGITAVRGSVTVVSGVITAISMSGGTAGSGYAGSTADLHPIAINGVYPSGDSSGIPAAYAQILSVSNTTASGGLIPTVPGVWTFVADESNSSTPMTVSLYANQGSIFQTLVPLVATYPQGTTTGKTWKWNVPHSQDSFGMTLVVHGPSAAAYAPWTLSNEFLAPPNRGTGTAQTVDQTKPYAINPNVANWMTSGSGLFPSILRTNLGSPIGTNVVDASDLVPANSFSYAGTGNLTICAIAARQYSLGTSPHIWTNENYPGTSAVGGGPSPYAWSPSNLNFLSTNTNPPYGNFIAEIVTASPHGLKTGQQLNFVGGPTNCQVYDSGKGITVTRSIAVFQYSPAVCFVTSATTFLVVVQDLTISAPNMCTLNATTNYNWYVTTPPVGGGYSIPAQTNAALAAALPNCDLHIILPQMMTDACCAAIAVAIRDTLPVGRRVLPEWQGEHWNYGYAGTFMNNVLQTLAAGSMGITAGGNDEIYTYMAARFHQVFVDTFNAADINGNTNRGGSIVRGFGTGPPNGSAVIISYANAYNMTGPTHPIYIDALLLARYLDNDPDITIAAAAASTYSNFVGSQAYKHKTPFTMGMYHDLYRHWLVYNPSLITVTGYEIANAAGFTKPPGQTVAPQIWCYECSMQTVIPTPPSYTDWSVRPWILYDFMYHPYCYDTEQGFLLAMQVSGIHTIPCNDLCGIFGGANGGIQCNGVQDSYNGAYYPYTIWEGQTWGLGDGTTDGNGNSTTNLFWNGTGVPHDYGNVSPKLQAWRDWALASNTFIQTGNIGTVLAHADTFAGVAIGASISSATAAVTAHLDLFVGRAGGTGGSPYQAQGSAGGANFAY